MSPITVPRSVAPSLAGTLPSVQPFYLADRQDWALVQERQRHDEALYVVGEYAVFVLMWHIDDFDAGLITRCSRCFGVNDTIAAVYNQPIQNKCPVCFGTTFEGGYKAILVRPSLWDFNEDEYLASARGEVTRQTASVQSTSDFTMRTGDYLLRSDGTRYQMHTMSAARLHTGFGGTTAASSVVGYNIGTATLEDLSSVAYLLPPSQAVITARLTSPLGSTSPLSFTDIEVVRAPVIS